jgi:hypothetical protein
VGATDLIELDTLTKEGLAKLLQNIVECARDKKTQKRLQRYHQSNGSIGGPKDILMFSSNSNGGGDNTDDPPSSTNFTYEDSSTIRKANKSSRTEDIIVRDTLTRLLEQ